MKSSAQCVVLAAWATLAMGNLSAKTVAWYHFNEGANATAMTGGDGVYAVTNSVAPEALRGRAYQITGKAFDLKDSGGSMPLWTNGTPACVSWFDPVTGARGEDNRCMWVRSTNDTGARTASIICVDDDAELHCTHLTAECMVKMPDGKSLANGWSSILVMRNGSTASDLAWGIRAQTDGRMMVHMTDVSNSANNFNGSTLGSGRGGSGYFYTPTPSGSIPSIVDGKWHHLAITYDGTTVRAYIDYVLISSIAWSNGLVYGSDDNSKLCIGGFDAATYGNWPGCIDEVRISDEALPPEKFLHVGGVDTHASDADTAVYLPFNWFEFSSDKFFGTVGQPIFNNSACSTNAGLIDLKLSTVTAGVFPRLDTGSSAVVSNTLHAGILASNVIENIGCWTYTNNPAYPEKARYITIDDYSKNNNKHLISAGDFTAEFYLKVPATPTSTSYILVENSGAKGPGTMQLYVTSSWLYCRLASEDALAIYESGTATGIATWNDAYVPIADIVGDTWHHVALVVNHMRRTAAFYVDRKLVRCHKNFVLASSVSTKSGYATLKIGDGWGGNNTSALHGLSIDEFRITRRALAPQEFLMTGVALDAAAREGLTTASTREWIDFDGDLSVKPSEAAVPDGVATTTTVSIVYSQDVPGVRRGKVVDGNGTVLRESNTSSMYFSGAHGYNESTAHTGSQRLFFERNLLLESDMKAMTVEFFMKGDPNTAKAWTSLVRGYGNADGADTDGQRLWGLGYRDAAGHIYAIMDVRGGTQALYYPDDTVSFADGRWHHVAATYEPDGNGNTLCKVYRDYVQVGTNWTFSGELEVGDHGTSSVAIGSFYNGYIDEVRVSKGVLSVDQMLHVYKRGMVIVVR